MKVSKKAKNPTFPFYASDFILDTISWTDAMAGRHIRLMCQQWVNGIIEVDEHGYPLNSTDEQKATFDLIKHKYFSDKSGGIKNKRLDKIKQEKLEFIKKSVKAGTDGASRRWGKDRVPNTNPNGKKIPLQSSSSSSSSNKIDSTQAFEFFRTSILPSITDTQIYEEIAKMEIYYEGQVINNLKTVCKAWAKNLKPIPKITKSSYV